MASLIPRHPESLPIESRRVIARLTAFGWAEDAYLAGSAALALYLGHRPVRDLDLMSSVLRLGSVDRRDILQTLLETDPACRVETARDGFLFTRMGADVGLRIFYYPYPLVETEADFEGLAVASPVDLGLMKLGAIISRGARRDFVDLFLLCRKVPLADLLERSVGKFGHVRDFPLQALKGLSDLSQTQDEPMPTLAQPLEWESIVAWARAQVETLGRQRLGLKAP